MAKEFLYKWTYDKGMAPEYASFIRNKHSGKIGVYVTRDTSGNWYVENPLLMGNFKDDRAEIPLRLLFQVDLWLFENNYEMEDLFVFPEV